MSTIICTIVRPLKNHLSTLLIAQSVNITKITLTANHCESLHNGFALQGVVDERMIHGHLCLPIFLDQN